MNKNASRREASFSPKNAKREGKSCSCCCHCHLHNDEKDDSTYHTEESKSEDSNDLNDSVDKEEEFKAIMLGESMSKWCCEFIHVTLTCLLVLVRKEKEGKEKKVNCFMFFW